MTAPPTNEAELAAWVAESPDVMALARAPSGGAGGRSRTVSIALSVLCGLLLVVLAFAAVPVGRCFERPRTAFMVAGCVSLVACGLVGGVGGFAASAGACS